MLQSPHHDPHYVLRPLTMVSASQIIEKSKSNINICELR